MLNAEVVEKVTRMEDILGEKTQSINDPGPVRNETNSKEKVAKKLTIGQQIPRGKPKSGRIWKEQKTRFSSIVKTRGIRSSLEKKQKLREDLKRVKEMSRTIKEQKQAELEAKKERRRQNLKRAEENRKKSEVVQVITNTAKLKKAKKKHLRMIEKRDTVNLKQN